MTIKTLMTINFVGTQTNVLKLNSFFAIQRKNRENLIENVLLVCSALKIFSAIKMSISHCREAKRES
jgi:hypothetical protein